MTGSTQQIVTSYEDCGLGVDRIVEAFEGEFDEVAVRAVLMQFSAKYRADEQAGQGFKGEPGFTRENEEAAIRTINNLLEYSDDEALRGRLAMYVREDRRGRRDAAMTIAKSAGATNIMQLQIYLNKAAEALKLTEQKSIDIKNAEVKVA
jgi:hypothetical protein